MSPVSTVSTAPMGVTTPCARGTIFQPHTAAGVLVSFSVVLRIRIPPDAHPERRNSETASGMTRDVTEVASATYRGFSHDVTAYKLPCHFPFMPVSVLQAWALNGQLEWYDIQRSQKQEPLGTYAFSVSTIAMNQFSAGINLPSIR